MADDVEKAKAEGVVEHLIRLKVRVRVTGRGRGRARVRVRVTVTIRVNLTPTLTRQEHHRAVDDMVVGGELHDDLLAWVHLLHVIEGFSDRRVTPVSRRRVDIPGTRGVTTRMVYLAPLIFFVGVDRDQFKRRWRGQRRR